MTQEKTFESLEEEMREKEAELGGDVTNGVEPSVATDATAVEEVLAAEESAPPLSPEQEQIAQLQAELAASQRRVEELTDQLQRTAADFQNSRRRQERQLAEAIERASVHLLKRLLPILDDLNLAFENVPPDVDESQQAWVAGFRQIQKKLNALLEEEGVTTAPLEGPFDPTHHEAITSEPHDEVPSGHIIETMRAGYLYKGRVLRPALVRIAG
jgi:molecular chaperone GrpE